MKNDHRSGFGPLRLLWLLLCFISLSTSALWADSKIIIDDKYVVSRDGDTVVVCGFDQRGIIKMFAKDVTADTCMWNLAPGVGVFTPFLSQGNMRGDTIFFQFDDPAGAGLLTVREGREATAPIYAKLYFKQVPQAAKVKDITWDAPICQNMPTTFKVPEDPTNYAPGSLSFRWTFMTAGLQDVDDGVNDYVWDVKTAQDFTYTHTFYSGSYDKGKVVATPYTCDGKNAKANKYRTGPTNRILEPFVKRGLYVDWEIHQLYRRIKIEPGSVIWVETEKKHPVCRSYKEYRIDWNEMHSIPKTDEEVENGYYNCNPSGLVHLEFGDYNKLREEPDITKTPEYYYSYHWEFDPEEFVFETDLMEKDDLYRKEGFGVNKSRIVLRVLEGSNNGQNKNPKVKVTVRCDTCIARGGNESDFTYTTTITLVRRDSILDFKDENCPIDFSLSAQGEVCAGQKATLSISMSDESQRCYDKSNATVWTLFKPRKWIQTECDDGVENAFCYITSRTSEEPGIPGDTIHILTSPTNECFMNLYADGQNGQTFKVYVKNPPVMPVIKDNASGRTIKGMYTKERWGLYKAAFPKEPDQEEESFERVLLCNFNASVQNASWLGLNQTYGLYIRNDSLYNPSVPNDPYVFRVVDYDNVLGGSLDKLNYLLERRTGSSSAKKDSSWIRLEMGRDAKESYANKNFKLGFYSFNACGVGDTGIFFFKVIDTVTTIDIQDRLLTDWDTLCEGTELGLFSATPQSHTWYMHTEGDPPMRPWATITTDRLDYHWKMPDDTWQYIGGSDSTSEKASVLVGRTSGPVRLRFGNRCGYGSYMEMPVKVHPYVRVNIEGDLRPCQGDTITYRFKRAELAEEYEITFPRFWEAVSHAYPPGSQVARVKDKDVVGDWVEVSAVVVPFHDQRVGWQNGAKFPITVVGSKNKVPGVPEGCNFTLEDPKHTDSLMVGIKPHPVKPIIDGDFPKLLSSSIDTLCANNVYTFQVKDTVSDDDDIRFSWYFPNDQWVRSGNSKIYDTITFTTPRDTSHVRTKIRVVANRNDCAGNNRKRGFPATSDTLDINLLLMNALPIAVQPGQSPFVDILKLRPDGVFQALNKRPCEGDTVCYVLKRRQDPSAYYAQFDWRPLNSTDTDDTPFDEVDRTPLTSTDWKVLSEAPYHDTLKMVVGRAPMRLRAANVSFCDTSVYREDTIRPISKVIAAGQIRAVRPDANLCEYEAVTFTFDTVEHATHYVFHYPWSALPDTFKLANRATDKVDGFFTDEGRYKVSFGDTLAYTAGKVYVEAYNSCGVRPTNDELTIVSVLRRQAAPVLKQIDFENFAYDAVHLIGIDSVLDTLCLRHPMVMEASPADAAAATAAGWQFFYAWGQVQTDAAVTKFEKYTSSAWTDPDANSGDSLWTITKEVSPVTTTYLWLSSRHKTCEHFGDSLTIALRNIDTTALKGTDIIWNYLYDKVPEKGGKRVHIQTKPCEESADNVAYYLDLAALDITGLSYYFRWRIDSTQAFANLFNPADKTIGGSKFILQNVPDDDDGDGEPDWTTLDTLKMKLPSSVDSLEIQVVITNRCEESQMPGLKVRTSERISEGDMYMVKQVSDYICDREKLTYKVVSLIPNGDKIDTVDGIEKAGTYTWYTPWHEKIDTTGSWDISFDTTAYKPGMVYVVPFNGCGDGHRSDSVKVKQPDILQPPLRVQPFAALPGYNPADGLVERVADSTCLRTNHTMTVKATLQQSEVQAENQPQNTLVYQWTMSKGKRSALNVTKPDSSEVVLNIPDFADSLYILHVAARRSVCQRYGDSLRIEVLPMDTIRFMASAVEDTLPYDRFAVLTRGVIQDIYPTPPLDSIWLRPCVGSSVTYSIKPDFHWSLVSSPAPSFSWNGGKTGTTPSGMLEGTTGWHCSDVSKLPMVIPIDEVGKAGDIFSLSVHAQNVCGSSVSGPLDLRPQPLIDATEKPVFKPLAPICEKDTVWVEVVPVANATHYVWTTKFPRGTQKDTTAAPKIGYANFDAPDATVSVLAFNACGTSLESDVLKIEPLLKIPRRPDPTWYANLAITGNTVSDTLCLYGKNLLSVKSALADGDEVLSEGMFYNWVIMPESENAAQWLPLPGHAPGGKFDGHDSIYLEPDATELSQGGCVRLMVAARRKSCPNYWSDTLYINIYMGDTVSVGTLGRLIWYDPLLPTLTPYTPKMPLCPGARVRIGIENPTAAPAYHWTFPDDSWSFAPGFTDTTGPVIDAAVGQTAGRIYVSPMTDADNRRCNYFADTLSALASDPITLHTKLGPREWRTMGNVNSPTPCAGTPTIYEISAPNDEDVALRIHHYRWEFPSGWRVYEDDEVTLTNSNVYETRDLTERRRVLPSADSGYVRVYGLSVCDETATPPSYSLGKEQKKSVNPIDTARLEVIADESVCKDSTLIMQVKFLNRLADTNGYDLSVRYIGSDAAVITNPDNPVVIRFPSAPDSTYLEVDWYSSDSVNLIFTPRNLYGCYNNVKPVVYALKADTVPTIKGRIIGPERVCMEALEVFEAQVEDLDTAETKVFYRWEVPSEAGWEIVKGGDSAVVVIRVGAYEDAELKQTIRCYPRALCGTGEPFLKELTINPPVAFNGSMVAAMANADGSDGTVLTDADRPCIGSNLNFTLTHDDKPEAANIKYVWETPLGWMRLLSGGATDSTERAAFTASRAGADTMRVRYRNLSDPNSCGLSRPLQYPIAIRDSAPAARLTDLPYICITKKEVDFRVAPDEEIEAVMWTTPADYPATAADYIATPGTDAGSRIDNNRLNLKRAAGFLDPFQISVRSINACGMRDTAIQINPVRPISALPADSLRISHYCVGDSAYAYVGIPAEYIGQGVVYRWSWEPDTSLTGLADAVLRENGLPAGPERIVWLRFTEVIDTATIVFYTSNDCVADLPPVSARTAPYTYTIEAKAGADAAVYAQEGISLFVDKTQFGTPADYIYAWQPEYRVQKQVSEDGLDTTFATKGLYLRWEHFNVISTERIDTAQPFYARSSACQSYDTVTIYVDSTFTVISLPTDTACVDAPYTLSVYPYGGNTSSYHFDWYRLSSDSVYEMVPEAGNGPSLTLQTVDTTLIRFMVVGRDSISVASEDSIYQYIYNPDNNEIIDSVLVPMVHVFSQIDTQYIELRSFAVGGRMLVPNKESIDVPLGTIIHLSAEATGGSGQYIYCWGPTDKMDSPDSTLSQAVTRRIYDDCDVNLTILDSLTGCSTLLKVHIGLSDEFGDVPNAFSPNGDGKNDVFMPDADNLVIFNRFGQEIYRATEEQKGWNGTYKGKVVADGDYLFVLTIKRNGREYTKRGTVTVITTPIR